jgi:hypothetical protein
VAVGVEREKRIAALRQQIAAVPARGAANPAATADPNTTSRRTGLPVPEQLRPVFPHGALARGSVTEMTGAGGPVLSIIAAVTAAGGFAALVGIPSAGLLAAVEQGAVLDHVALISDAGSDPLAVVASVLADGMDLIVWDPMRAHITPSTERVAAGRIRTKQATLITTGPGWQRPDLRIHSEVTGYGGIAPSGGGRLQSIDMRVRSSGKSFAPTETRYRLAGSGGAVVAETLEDHLGSAPGWRPAAGHG